MRRGRGIPFAPIGGALAIAVPAGVFLWFVGISLASTIAFGLTVVAAGVAWAGYAGMRAPVAGRIHPNPRPGTRSDVSQLAWALRGRDGRVSDPGFARVRSYARTQIARHGLNLDSAADEPRLRAVLGDGPYALLTRSGGPLPPISAVERCLDALDRLDARPHPEGHP